MKKGILLAMSSLLLFGCGTLEDVFTPGSIWAQERSTVRGTVVDVFRDRDSFVLEDEKGEIRIQLTDDARVMRAVGPSTPAFKPATLKDLRLGMTVRAELTGLVLENPGLSTYMADTLYLEGMSQSGQQAKSGQVLSADAKSKTLKVQFPEGVREVIVTPETDIAVELGPDMPPILSRGELWTRMVGRPVTVVVAKVSNNDPPQYLAAQLVVR